MTPYEVRELEGEGTVDGGTVFDNRTDETPRRGEGKLDLIATGFGEAAVAVNNAARYVNPYERVNPGHSISMAVFED